MIFSKFAKDEVYLTLHPFWLTVDQNALGHLARKLVIGMYHVLNSDHLHPAVRGWARTNPTAPTLEALAKLHHPRKRTVRHVHVNEGGQAVIVDKFHHHTGGQQYGQSAD